MSSQQKQFSDNLPYVEFLGIAGAGKTEATAMLVSDLQQRGVLAVQRKPIGTNPLLRMNLLGAYVALQLSLRRSNPHLFRLHLKPAYATAHRGQQTVSELVQRIVRDSTVIQYYRTHHDHTILVNDEGLVQKVVELLVLTELSLSDARVLLRRLLPYPAVIVGVEVPTQVANNRAEKRGVALPFLDAMDIQQREQFSAETYLMWERLSEDLRNITDLSLIAIHNSGEKEMLSKEIGNVAEMLMYK